MNEPLKGFWAGCPWQISPELQAAAIANLHLQSWLTWLPDAPLPMAWNMDESTFEAARAQPGRFWALLNEPESASEASLGAAIAAQKVRDWHMEFGPNYAAPGVLVGGEGMAWMDVYLAAQGPVPVMWHCHIYAHSPDHWADLWGRWKEWMRVRGVERKVIVSECAAWGPLPSDQINVMDEVQRHLQTDPLLHSAYWFAAAVSEDFSWWTRSSLVGASGQPTTLGEHYLLLTGQAAGAGELTDTTYLPTVSAV